MEQKTFKAWITKYALTKGIIVVNAIEINNGCPGMIYCKAGDYYVYNPHWHRTYTDSIIKAENMRIKKIASLKKKIAKLESMTFKVIESVNGWQTLK